jgi:DnaK suppressor protein
MENKICELPEKYVPSSAEEFMCDPQREYFRRKLLKWKDDLTRETTEAVKDLRRSNKSNTDMADFANSETDLAYELRSKERASRLINKIDEALLRIENGTYGYCSETGDPIPLKRLEARPIATLSIEAQERHEQHEKVHNDDFSF